MYTIAGHISCVTDVDEMPGKRTGTLCVCQDQHTRWGAAVASACVRTSTPGGGLQ